MNTEKSTTVETDEAKPGCAPVNGSASVVLRVAFTPFLTIALLAYLKPPQTKTELFGMFVCGLVSGVTVFAWHEKTPNSD